MFKNIKIALISFLFIFHFSLNSAEVSAPIEPIVPSTTNEETVEGNMNNLTNRLILAAFGKQALTWFDVEGDIDYNSKMNNDDETYYSKPFNKNNFNLFKSFLIISLIIGTLIFSIYLFWIAKVGLTKTQSSGSFLGDDWNPMFIFAKIAIVTLLLYPAYFPYNVSHMLLFKALGYSNIAAEEITKTIIEYQPRAFNAIKYPSSTAKKDFGEDLISYLVCSKKEMIDEAISDNELSLNFEYENGEYSAVSRFGNCVLTIDFAIDNSTSKIIEKNEKIKKALNLTESFEKIQLNIMERIINDALKQADTVSNNLMEIPTVLKNLGGGEEDVTFSKYKISSGAGNDQEFAKNWEKNCDSIINLKNIDSWSPNDRREYAYLGSRCISHSIVKALTYPDYKPNFSSYLKSDNYLKGNEIDLCSHSFDDPKLKGKSLIKESNDLKTSDLKEIQKANEGELNIREVSLESCLLKECQYLNSLNSNIYTCSNVIHVYDQFNKISSTGFLTLGAYMYTMFNNGQANTDSKTLLNKLNSTYENIPYYPFMTIEKANGLIIKYKFNPPRSNSSQYGEVKSIGDSSIITTYKQTFDKRDSDAGLLSNFGVGAYNDFLGFTRFSNCIENPLQLKNGYSCGSVPSEMHYMGKNIFEFSVDVKIMMHTYQAIFATGNVVAKSYKANKVDANKKSENTSQASKDNNKKGKSNIAKRIITPIISAFPALAPMYNQLSSSFVFDLVSRVKPEPDEFGNLTSDILEDQLIGMESLTSNGIALIAMAGGKSSITQAFNVGVNLLMLLGLLFAYVLPLVPIYLWLIVIMGWLLSYFETITILPIWIPTLATPNDSSSSRAEKEGLLLIFKLFLKAPLLCLGILVAWIFTNTIISRLSGYINIDKMFSMQESSSMISLLDTLVLGVVYCLFLWYIVSLAITLIETFYDFTTSFLSGRSNSRLFGKDVGTGFFRKGSRQSTTMSQLNPLKTKMKKKR